MKSCFIVNYWADTDDKVKMVVDGIQQLKKTGRDVVYTSLCPIDKKISEVSAYSIFHSKNELISLFDFLDNEKIEGYTTVSFYTEDFDFFSTPLNQRDVSFSVSKQLVTNLKMLKSLGYDYFHYFVGDCFIADEELNVFDYIEKSCSLYNKKAYFDNLTHRFNGYGAIYFSSNIDFFLDRFVSITDKRDFVEKYRGFSFEKILKDCFEPCSDDLILGKNDSDSFGHSVLFKNSQLDIVTTFNANVHYYIIPLESVAHIFVVSNNTEPTNFKIYIDDEFEEGNIGYNNFIHLKTAKKSFNLRILKNDVEDFNEFITEKRLERIRSYSFFTKYKLNI